MLQEYLEFWRRLDCYQRPYVHPDDEPVLFGDDFKRVRGGNKNSDAESTALHLDLLPAPHTGDLARAEIIVLTLNPSTSIRDYHDNLRLDYTKRLIQNIRQELTGVEFPCVTLDPQFEYTGGYEYWNSGRMLRDVIGAVAAREGSRDRALRLLANKMATIEAIPYKSRKFDGGIPFEKLPSVRMAKRLINEYMKPAAAKGQKLVIVVRAVRRLGFEYEAAVPGFILYPQKLARGANLGIRSPGGKAILAHLGMNC